MITFYDFASTVPGKTFNPNTWKTRYSLNYKQLPYKTEWVEFSEEIEKVCKKMGIPPTSKRPDGSGAYTLPAIYDDSTKTGVADSLLIAAYLDKTYPDTPKLLPAGTEALQTAFVDAFMSKFGSSWQLSIPLLLKLLLPSNVDFYVRTRSAALGKPLLDILPVGEEREAQWKSLKAGLSVVDAWYQKNGGGPFIMGNTPSFADFVVGGFFSFVKAGVQNVPEPEWKEVLEGDNGRWKKLGEALEKYEVMV
ncbi:hypothetical protein BDQ12DRAFT_687874 [Crucibulum laeve]|uniref:GST N-terminal domain-containing protein n=1 Tax=Crucibulum laeve TaxID=68775 RepID=A0A5C3LRN3_9AGAR|nr:hypothetical protein BDQ12DRAFT_687874 [Crucibulum laeve]